jgi:hypothetical protein
LAFSFKILTPNSDNLINYFQLFNAVKKEKVSKNHYPF